VAYVEDMVGENVIGWGSHFFCKMPHDGKRVAWHQDASYWPSYRPSNPDEHNVLDQTVENAEQYGTPVDVELRAGEASIHSDLLLHGSEANELIWYRRKTNKTFGASPTRDGRGVARTNRHRLNQAGSESILETSARHDPSSNY